MTMREVVIVGAARTPVGRYRGGYAEVRADHLAAVVLQELSSRTGVSPSDVGEVIMGCVTQVGEQCGNIARTSMLSAGWPETIPGLTVDRKCGSSEAAVHLAFAQIAAGLCDVVVAGGAENMTRVPMGGNRDVHGNPFGWKLTERFEHVSQGEAAERIADKWALSRHELDAYSLQSHQRAANAADGRFFDREMVPVPVGDWSESRTAAPLLTADETIRRDTSIGKLATLKATFRADGKMSAGNSSQISDGAAALLLMSTDLAGKRGIAPRARIRAAVSTGADPTLMLTGPIEATRLVLERAGLALRDIDLFEVNEAFASVPLMWLKETGASPDKLNVNGGAIALGHPLGASGARIMTTLLHEMERRDVQFGLQTVCCAGGLATATVIERGWK